MDLMGSDPKQTFFRLVAIVLRIALVAALAGAAWLVYQRLPADGPVNARLANQTAIQIALRLPANLQGARLDIPVEFSPVDIVAVRHEFNSEPRSGKRFDEFLKERKSGRVSVSVTLDNNGRGSANVPPGEWWVHAVAIGEEALEWRLHVKITGSEQTIDLTPENVYTRSRSF